MPISPQGRAVQHRRSVDLDRPGSGMSYSGTISVYQSSSHQEADTYSKAGARSTTSRNPFGRELQNDRACLGALR